MKKMMMAGAMAIASTLSTASPVFAEELESSFVFEDGAFENDSAYEENDTEGFDENHDSENEVETEV